MVIELRVSTSPPPISLGSIILPLQRQLPTELPKALVSAGSGRGMFPCGPPLSPDCPSGGCVRPDPEAPAFGSLGGFEVLPVFPVLCCACAARATRQLRANNRVLIASLLLFWPVARTLSRAVRGGNMPNHRVGFAGAVLLSCACAHGKLDGVRERKALMDADAQFARETAERGVEAWAAWFAEDGAMYPARIDPAQGRAAIRELMSDLYDPRSGR